MTEMTRPEPRWLSHRYSGEPHLRAVSEMTFLLHGTFRIARLPASNCQSHNTNESRLATSLLSRNFVLGTVT
jgi:hypothetical protein